MSDYDTDQAQALVDAYAAEQEGRIEATRRHLEMALTSTPEERAQVVDLDAERARRRVLWPAMPPVDPTPAPLWAPEHPAGFYAAAKGRWLILARAVRHGLVDPKPRDR